MTRTPPLLVLAAALLGCVTRDAGQDVVEVDVAGREITGHDALGGALEERVDAARALREDGNLEAALIAFRLAEDDAAVEEKAALRLERATTLRRMAMPEAALEVLGPLGRSEDPAVRGPALALAGVLHAERDDLTRAEDLLRRAVAGDDRWPGHAAALHDLGVVLLRSGDERGGIELLHRARDRHLEDGSRAGAAAAYRTEATYWRIEGAGETADRLLREAERLGAVR